MLGLKRVYQNPWLFESMKIDDSPHFIFVFQYTITIIIIIAVVRKLHVRYGFFQELSLPESYKNNPWNKCFHEFNYLLCL